jgi:hypothetical protein
MGEIDQKKENIVDEKIWGEDEEEQPNEQEKMEVARISFLFLFNLPVYRMLQVKATQTRTSLQTKKTMRLKNLTYVNAITDI